MWGSSGLREMSARGRRKTVSQGLFLLPALRQQVRGVGDGLDAGGRDVIRPARPLFYSLASCRDSGHDILLILLETRNAPSWREP